jgi:hypothetical protein
VEYSSSNVYVPDQEFVRLSGGKTKPEDRTGEIGPAPVGAEESRFDKDSMEFAY